jgi:hypothetical protein
MRISIQLELNAHLAVALTALLFSTLTFFAMSDVPGKAPNETLLPAVALAAALAAGQTNRRPRL